MGVDSYLAYLVGKGEADAEQDFFWPLKLGGSPGLFCQAGKDASTTPLCCCHSLGGLHRCCFSMNDTSDTLHPMRTLAPPTTTALRLTAVHCTHLASHLMHQTSCATLHDSTSTAIATVMLQKHNVCAPQL